MALILWEIMPVVLVTWFFWVKKHATYEELKNIRRIGSTPASLYYEVALRSPFAVPFFSLSGSMLTTRRVLTRAVHADKLHRRRGHRLCRLFHSLQVCVPCVSCEEVCLG